MRTISASEIIDGKAIKYIDVFGVQDNIALKSKFEGKTYWIYDYYCMHAACHCDDVYLKFIEEDENSKATGRHFGVRKSFKNGEMVIEDRNLPEQKANEVAAEALNYSPEVVELFKQRYAQMKLEGHNIITKESKKPIVNENVIGRNDPCTCGSGKKYKKCCGIA